MNTSRPISPQSSNLDRLFRNARTPESWSKDEVPQKLLKELYTLLSLGPTSANCSPSRFVFVISESGKQKLLPHLSKNNKVKTAEAPVTAIVAYDLNYLQDLTTLFPHKPDAVYWFGDAEEADRHALRNSSMQAAYLILAARALGLDCGPMSGFDPEGVRDSFFNQEPVVVNLVCNIGYGDHQDLKPRLPRHSFDKACRFA